MGVGACERLRAQAIEGYVNELASPRDELASPRDEPASPRDEPASPWDELASPWDELGYLSVQLVEEFYSTYGAAAGNAMYLAPEDRIAMWGEASS